MKMIEYLCEDLRRAVKNVREAANEIWKTPKHKYYTDHTVDHSDRIVKKLKGLIHGIMHGDHPLSQHEIYILLAAAYLHDIGMQNERFEGGDLEKIRRVHEKISYEMIIGSSQNPDLYRSLNLLKDPDLVEAVGLVAQGHRKTDLKADCYNEFSFGDDIIRPRLLAAFLRLADSLDIDQRRVIMENLKLAEISSESNFHWHRCYYVAGVSVDNEFISVSFRLPPDKGYELLIVSPLLEEIDDELTSLAPILRHNGAKIGLAEPDVRHLKLVEEMPFEVHRFAEQALQQKNETTAIKLSNIPVDQLARELIFWLKMMSYNIVDQRRLDECCTQLVAEKNDDLTNERILLHCVDGEITVLTVQSLEEALIEKNIHLGWTVSDKRVANSARVYASEKVNIRVLTITELIHGVFGKYFQYLKDLIEEGEISSHYVNIACEKPIYDQSGQEITRDTYAVIDDYIDNWLEERGKNHISVLGEFGTGKTWFCRHFAYRQLQRFLEHPTNQRIPLLVNLRDYRSVDLEQLITDLLVNRYGIRIGGYGGFDILNRNGRLLLLFDGFDEMTMHVDDISTIKNFETLARTAVPGGKVLLTCRTPYFRDYLESYRVLSGGLGESLITKRPNFEVIYLREFDKEQIKEVLKKRVSNMWEDYWLKIKEIYDLPNLAHRPVILDMIIMTLPELEGRQSIDHSMLYKTYTDKWIEKAIEEERTLLDAESKRFFAQEIAWEMFKKETLTVNSLRIRELVERYLEAKLKKPKDILFLEHDIRTASFISKRDELGNYEFMHRSFMEFFVAQKLANAIKKEQTQPLEEQEIYYEIIRFLNQLLDPTNDKATITKWRDDIHRNHTLRTNCIRISGQWDDKGTIMKLIKMISNVKERTDHRRDAIRSAIRILHGEEVDWNDRFVKQKLYAFAIRTSRDNLKVECLPIELKILHAECLSDDKSKLRANFMDQFLNVLLKCLCSGLSEPKEIRVNASYAMIHFAQNKMDQTLYKIAQNDESVYVRFNCWTALMTLDSPLSKTAIQQISTCSEDSELIRLARANLLGVSSKLTNGNNIRNI